jgi:hypothetical protein
VLERRPFTAEDRARLASALPRFPQPGRMAIASDWVVDGDTYLLEMTDCRDPRAGELCYLFSYDSRRFWLGIDDTPGGVQLSWHRWPGLEASATERITSLIQEAYCLLHPQRSASEVTVEAQDAPRLMSEEARQQMQARLDAIGEQVSASMALAAEGARARQATARAIGVTLIAGGAALLAIALFLLR